MKHRKMHEKDIIGSEKAQQILMELYKIGHGLADFAVEHALGNSTGREEREAIIQDAFLELAQDIEQLEPMSLEKRLQRMSIVVSETARRKRKN